ncbi:MAG: FAD:protein FMN transferase [Propionibacteriaceae bacterium]|jgi:thiamine biosynthesis lipoprotein ApbE|nr:FAD:protein FMN transferase [Propionibacteriaceae bacterium]
MLTHGYFTAMHTVVSLALAGPDAEAAIAVAERIAVELDGRLSRFRPTSEVAALNASDKPIHVSDAVDRVLGLAVRYRQETEGRFDVTLGTGGLRRREPGVWQADGKVDLGGIGKGFCVDEILAAWQGLDLEYGYLSFGQSSIGCFGEHTWRLGIRAGGQLLGPVEIGAGRVSTSAAAGYPEAGLRLATVLGDAAAACEAWSTALVVGGERLLARLPKTMRTILKR